MITLPVFGSYSGTDSPSVDLRTGRSVWNGTTGGGGRDSYCGIALTSTLVQLVQLLYPTDAKTISS
jgi:hypothetical protein